MILLALAKPVAILEVSSINTQCTAIIFIHSLPSTTQLPRGETLFHLPLTHILEIFKDSSSTIWNYLITFWPATSSSNQQQHPAAAINSSNQQQQSTAATSSSNQQQQPAAAINSSNQQQQSTAAINSSNQQQQSTAAINSSNNQLSFYQQLLHYPRRLLLVITTVLSWGYVRLEVDLGLAAR